MIEAKFLVCGGLVKSKRDGQIHKITASQLVGLYGLKRSEYIIEKKILSGCYRKDLIHLGPRRDGDYREYIEELKKSGAD